MTPEILQCLYLIIVLSVVKGKIQGRTRWNRLKVRAEMFGQLTTGFETAWNKLRGVGMLILTLNSQLFQQFLVASATF